MYDARSIANWFVRRAAHDGRSLTIMGLLKLVYIAHGWHLAMRKSPLVMNKIEAWKFGPVIPDMYGTFRGQGIDISRPSTDHDDEISVADDHLLREIYRLYGHLPAERLSELTHVPNGPWDQATRKGGWFAPIPNELIQRHYEEKRAAAQRV